jgi:3-methyl-2-oxobutanoate hydroxymethyltransferase
LGGYRLQGKDPASAQVLQNNALQMAQSGAAVVLFELIPGDLARSITQTLPIPTIGIGAGVHCDGQVLVLHDMLNLSSGKKPRFVGNFMAGQNSVQDALASYVQAVKSGSFPGPEHTFSSAT